MEENIRPRKRTYVIVISAVVVVLLALLAFLYCVMSWRQADRFPEQTYINSIDVSGMTVGRAKRELARSVEQYELTIRERDGKTETITGEEIGLAYVDNGDVDDLFAQYNPYRWFLDNRRTDELVAAADTGFDQEMARAAVEGLTCFTNYVPAQDAFISEVDDGYAVTPEVQGTELQPERAQSAILDAIRAGAAEVDLEAEGLYVVPEIRADDPALNAKVDALNDLLRADITFDFGDDRVVRVNARAIKGLIVENEAGEMELSLEKVTDLVRTKMAYRIDTFGLTHTVTTHNGTTINLKGGDYGWCIARNSTAQKLYDAILEGYQGEMEAEYQYKGKHMGVDDIGGTYVEVSIDQQMMWLYKDYQEVLATPVVTGNISLDRATPYGSVWAIDGKQKDAVLGSLDTVGYEAPVNYWMPFNGNVGIHDADKWRSAYGGDIYLTNGSRGCVNTPLAACEVVFNTVERGTAVVVYNLSDPETDVVSLPGEFAPPPDPDDWDWDD